MAQNKTDSGAVDALRIAVASGRLEKLYIFHGAERYLLENIVDQIRKQLIDGAFAEFNHKRFEGQGLSMSELQSACDTLPAFAERTLIEVVDFDMFKGSDEAKQKLIALVNDLPDYICLIFIYDVLEWKPDGRLKLTEEIKKNASIVEFAAQEQPKLVKWIKNHFAANEKSIDTPTAEYLAELTGGLMTALNSEIDKVSSYTNDKIITRAHIDAIVTPALEAVVFRLTDHIAAGNFSGASTSLYDLLCMREDPQFLIYMITQKLRQLLAARLCIDNSLGEKHLVTMGAVKFEWQARSLLVSARKITVQDCRSAVLLSSETAYRMLTVGDAEARLTELLVTLAESRRRTRI